MQEENVIFFIFLLQLFFFRKKLKLIIYQTNFFIDKNIFTALKSYRIEEI